MSERVLIIGTVWPEPTSSAAGLHHWSLIRAFQQTGWSVTYVSPSNDNAFAEALRNAGVETHTFLPNDSRFDEFVRNLRPDYAIFDRFMLEEQFGWRVHENSPETVRVVDTVDLHSLRRTRHAAFKANTPLEKIYSAELELVNDDSLREIASIYRSDLSLIISDFELRLLQEKFNVPSELLQYFPFCYAPAEPGAGFSSRNHFVMIGNFRHPPNADATHWLHREIWPLILKEWKKRALPGKPEVHLYGAYPPREIMALQDPSRGFWVKGPAEDQYQTLAQYRVNLAPLRFGAGIKGKIADGWWCGLPVVTTPIGSEGMGEGLSFGGKIGHSAEEIASHAVDLYTQEDEWRCCRDQGLSTLNTLFHSQKNYESLIRGLKETRRNLLAHRARNFIGAMLWHHLHKSTTYFSRWIELKNQKN